MRDAHHPDTDAIHGPHPERTGSVSTPLVHSATFTFDSLDDLVAAQQAGPAGAFYQRVGHPTVRAVEERLAQLEGGEGALLFASGMGAIGAAFLGYLSAGDHVVCVDPCYGGTQALLGWGAKRFGWAVTFVDVRRPETWAAAFRPETKLLHLECPTNPTLAVFDIAEAAALGRARGARVTIDNTIASPIGQHPLALGCHLSLYSATKSINGHSDVLAGAAIGAWIDLQPVVEARKVFGPTLDPTSAWLIERSLKTMPLRVRASNANALELAGRLAGHPAVAQVFYPGLASHPGHAIAARQQQNGFGPLLSFDVKAGPEASRRLVDALHVFKNGASLGGVESLATLPALTSHVMIGAEGRRRAGIPEALVRLSVGAEHVDDLWEDLQQALAAS